jgi:hypothetical protein
MDGVKEDVPKEVADRSFPAESSIDHELGIALPSTIGPAADAVPEHFIVLLESGDNGLRIGR